MGSDMASIHIATAVGTGLFALACLCSGHAALPRSTIPFDSATFDKYVGYYQVGRNVVLTVTRDRDHFFTRFSRQLTFEIYPESPNTFFYKLIPAEISFESDPQGKATTLVLHEGGRERAAPRIDEGLAKSIEASLPPPGHPMARTWRTLAGVTPKFLTNVPGAMDYWPCFSPDGKTVVFSRTTDGLNWNLMRVPTAGGEVQQLAQTPLSVAATRPSWSSKTNEIAFTGIPLDGSGSTSAIWIINGDGTEAHVVAADGLSNQMFYPSWYPDGKSLVAQDGRNLVIKRLNLASGGTENVTDRAQILTGMPSVSPDGKWIAFAGQRNSGQSYNQEDNVIWLAGETGALNTLEANPAAGRTPAWSPDGRRLAFESDRGSPDGRYAIFVVNRDGTGLVQVTDYSLNAQHPVWSPDGGRLAFSAMLRGADNAAGIAIVDYSLTTPKLKP